MKNNLLNSFLSLLLALCMLLSCTVTFTACGNSSGGDETEDTSGSSETDENAGNWIDYGTTPLAPTGHSTGNFDRTKFHIGTYGFDAYEPTEEIVRSLSECGVDLVAAITYGTAELDLLGKYGIGIVYHENPFTIRPEILNHPACYAIDLQDEPKTDQLPELGRRLAEINEEFPNRFTYMNLFPSYAGVGSSYAKYLQTFVESVPTDYICYDHYPYGNDSQSAPGVEKWYENLIAVADVCTENNRSMWVAMQGNDIDGFHDWSGVGDFTKSGNRMRFQAYTAMAFGTELISWWAWRGPDSPSNMEAGEERPLYDVWKEVNTEIRGFADEFMKYRRMSTSFVGFDGWYGRELVGITKGVASLSVGAFEDFCATDKNGKKMVVGELAPRNGDGSSALMIADATDFDGNSTATYEATFKVVDSRTIKAYQGDTVTELTPDENGVYHLTVTPYAGILLVAERK